MHILGPLLNSGIDGSEEPWDAVCLAFALSRMEQYGANFWIDGRTPIWAIGSIIAVTLGIWIML